MNSPYAWNDAIRQLTNYKKINSLKQAVQSTEYQLKLSNSKLASIELILDDYYNGGYTDMEELVEEISCVLNNKDND